MADKITTLTFVKQHANGLGRQFPLERKWLCVGRSFEEVRDSFFLLGRYFEKLNRPKNVYVALVQLATHTHGVIHFADNKIKQVLYVLFWSSL